MTIGLVVPGCPLAPLRPDRKRHSLWQLSAGQKTGQKAAQPVAKPDRKRHSLWGTVFELCVTTQEFGSEMSS